MHSQDNDQFSGKLCREPDSQHFLPLVIELQSADGHKADSHAERNQIDWMDSTCAHCDLCRNTAPDFFRRNEETGFSVVYRQPVTLEEIALAEEARQGCPTESIGNERWSSRLLVLQDN